MPPCGNCQEWVRILLPQNTWFFRLSRMMPTLGLNPSRSSIINPKISLKRLLHRYDGTQPLGFPALSPRVPPSLTLCMKASQFFISTLKEAPADAEVVSHK